MFPSWIKLLKGWVPNEKPNFWAGRYEWCVYKQNNNKHKLVGILEYKKAMPKAISSIPPNTINSLFSIFSTGKAVPENKWEDFCQKCAKELSIKPDIVFKLFINTGLIGRFTRLKRDENSIHSVWYGPTDLMTKLMKNTKKEYQYGKRWGNLIKGSAHTASSQAR